MSDPDEQTTLDPADAFDVLGNETRVMILRALLETDGPLTFSELRSEVGVRDSSRFNYHLQKLVGHFVEETDEGYGFRYPGRRIAHATLAGTFNERARMDPVDAPGECYHCGTDSLRAAYEDDHLSIWCEDCDTTVVDIGFSPAALSNRDPEAVLAAFDQWSTNQASLAVEGVCPECAGEMVGSVTDDVPEMLEFPAIPVFECRVCRRTAILSFGSIALNHPEVQSFHHRRDVFPRTRPYWTIPQLVSDRYTEVVETDPWRIEITFPVGDDAVTAVVDESAEVVDVFESDTSA